MCNEPPSQGEVRGWLLNNIDVRDATMHYATEGMIQQPTSGGYLKSIGSSHRRARGYWQQCLKTSYPRLLMSRCATPAGGVGSITESWMRATKIGSRNTRLRTSGRPIPKRT